MAVSQNNFASGGNKSNLRDMNVKRVNMTNFEGGRGRPNARRNLSAIYRE